MNRAGVLIEGLVNFFVALVVGFLGLRFILRLLAANPGNTFVSWIYDVTAELLAPFQGIFPQQVIEGGYVVEFSTLFAMLIYAVIGYLILALVSALTPAPVTRTVEKKR